MYRTKPRPHSIKLRDFKNATCTHMVAGKRFNRAKRSEFTYGEKILKGEFIGGKVGLRRASQLEGGEESFIPQSADVSWAEEMVPRRRRPGSAVVEAQLAARASRRKQRIRMKLGCSLRVATSCGKLVDYSSMVSLAPAPLS